MEHIEPEIWFPAAKGLKTVRGLLRHFRERKSVVDNWQWAVKYLEEVESLLEKAEKQNIGFHLTAAPW